MIVVDLFAGKTVALVGLAGSGLVTAQALKAGGTKVLVHDDDPGRLKAATSKGLIAANLKRANWSTIDALILAPGVPLTHPEPHWSVPLAKAAHVEIIGDLELFFRVRRQKARQVPVIAITGTNGKSTTTALITHLLQEAGYDVQMGGNIGTPVLALNAPDTAKAGQVYVLEMSSYQIDLTPSLDPTIGLLLNVSPDHLDRHGSMENYVAVKERLVARATSLALIGQDDKACQAISGRLAARAGSQILIEAVTTQKDDQALWRSNGQCLYAPFIERPFADLSNSETLRGQHNCQNALNAAAACRHLGLTDDQIAAALLTFPGLAHRMEVVARRGSVLFVNDSKATNADAAARALAAYDHIYWIAGGQAKTGGIASLTKYFTKFRHSYVIGEAAELFAETLSDAPGPVTRHGSLAEAVLAAAQDAQQDPADQAVVLLSPACASWDQFASFEARGNAFKDAVLTLEGIEPF